MRKQTWNSAGLARDHSGNSWQFPVLLYFPFPSFGLLSSVFLPISLVLTEPPGDRGGLAVCHVEVGNEDSVMFDLGCSCPFLPWDREGARTRPQGFSELQCVSWRSTAPGGFADSLARLVSTLGSASAFHLGPWGCPALLSTFEVCPSYLLTKCLGVTGTNGVTEGKKSKAATEGGGQILEGLECHTAKFRHAPGDEAGQWHGQGCA